MKTFVSLFLIIPVFVVALPRPPQRPIILDELKAGNISSSDLKRECFENFNVATDKNETICITNVVNPGDNNKKWDWGTKSSTQYCGYIDYDNENAHYYFWLVMSEHSPLTAPLVLWLNGGPGASSMLGLFDQWGPKSIARKKDPDNENEVPRLQNNNFRTTENLNWVFLEHPIGVGFSTGDRAVDRDTSNKAAQDVYQFLTGFFKYPFAHAEKPINFLKNPLHIAGESYAGHYIPAIGKTLLEKDWPPNLQSLIIGNGATDQVVLVSGMSDLFCDKSGPLLNNPPPDPAIIKTRCEKMFDWSMNCLSKIEICRNNKRRCGGYVTTACAQPAGGGWAEALGRDYYDYTKDAANQAARTKHYKNTIAQFMNLMKTDNLIAADPSTLWVHSSSVVKSRFTQSGDWSASYLGELEYVMGKGLNVLLFAGDQDLAVPFTAVKATAEELRWNNRDTFRECLRRPEDQLKKLGTYGSYVRFDQLTFARIYGAGHMINENKPAEAKDMFEKWILRNTEFTNCV